MTQILEVPRPASIARRTVPHLFEATIVPLVLFYTALRLVGGSGALAIGLAWSYGAITVRCLRGRRLPGVLVLGALAMTARTAIALATGSVFVYFLQSSLGTVLVGLTFLVSLALGRPLAARLADDFCPLPSGFHDHPGLDRFFRQITLLWALVQLGNAALTTWLLVSHPLTTFLWLKPLVSWACTGAAIATSIAMFRRVMHRYGTKVQWVTAPATVQV
jgi:hypothetical protein